MENSIAQQNENQIHYYYIEEASYDILNPQTNTRNPDKTRQLIFSDQSITNFFGGLKIYSYVREFKFSRFSSLHKYYLLGLDDANKDVDLLLNSSIVSAEYAGTIEDIEGKPLNTPNDYFDHQQFSSYVIPHWAETDPYPGDSLNTFTIYDIRAYEHLDLINARRAWHIDQGNPNVEIGIRDIFFNQIHPELANKVTTTYGTMSTTGGGHGVSVAGTAAGDTNNGIGISSIGYDSSLVLSTGSSLPPGSFAGQALFLAENNNNIKVINISMGSEGTAITSQEEAFQHIKDSLNVTVVVAAGNGRFTGSNITEYYWPASYENVISVSSVGSYNKYGHEYDNGISVDWKDVHDHVVNYNEFYNHQHNDKVDIVAPGYTIPVITNIAHYRVSRGTSYASPIVAGVAGLMYSANPNITAERVKEILQETADDKIYDIPQNQPYIGKLGAGRVNAYGAVLKAECEYNGNPVGLDLNMQNTKEDFGDEPDVDSGVIWNSPGIWVRNTNDGFLYKESEDLHFENNTTPVYVYVRVTNDSCHPSTGTEQLELYWAKGGMQQIWPTVWDGSANVNLPVGGFVNTQTIPTIDVGKYEILEFQWQPQDPEIYEDEGFEKPWMFCFLSRIVTPDDPMSFVEVANVATNTRNNNNIAYHNATVINVNNKARSQGSIIAGNIGNTNTIVTDIEFLTNTSQDHNLWQDSEVRVVLNEDLWDLWQDSGAQSHAIKVTDPSKRQMVLESNHASLDSIEMRRDEWGLASVGVNFLINNVHNQEEYKLHVQQLDTNSQESLGGFTFLFIRDNERQNFSAESSRTENADGTETFYAQSINEDAKYNWYDEDGVLIYSGSDFTVSNLVAKEYKLEVVADYDGHIDYKTVETVDKRGIVYLGPNPASTNLDIGYLVADTDNAYIMLTNSTTGLSYNFILNAINSNQLIPVNQMSQGTYIVNLIANGEIIDTKNLIIN